MKAKQHIYKRLHFMLLILLFAGSTLGCSNDPEMEEDITSGKTTLSITVRGITITEPTDDNYDDYVGTLRVIGYDYLGNTICNIKYENLPKNENVEKIQIKNEEFYKIKNLELERFVGGICYLYFIANEDDYTISVGNKNSLGDEITDAPDKSSLEGGKITFNATSNKELGTFPILMTSKLEANIKGGIEQEIINPVQLVRCVAKLKLIVKGDNQTYSLGQVTVTGASPNNYALWEASGYTGYGTSVYDKNLTMSYSESQSSSQEIYFPEKLYGTQINYTGLLKFKIPVTRDGILNTYEVEIGKDMDDGSIDYNIRRNTIYTVTATLGWNPNFTVLVNSWDEKTINIPAFK